jgi:hypothetical protein
MPEVETGPVGPSEPIPTIEAPANTPDAMSATAAARLLASLRRPKEQPAEVAPTEAAPAEEIPAQAEDGEPQEAHAETESPPVEAVDEGPPIEPPGSWRADAKEKFRTLPRETQEYLVERESERERLLTRGQQETAERLRGLTAKEQQVEQARQQYEAALPQLLQTLQTQQAGAFSDIKSIEDVERLAQQDWPRYLQWDVAQKKVAAVTQEMQSAYQRQMQERANKFAEFAKREDSLFVEKAPEMTDAAKAAKLQSSALNALKDMGFSDQELAQSWHGERDISLRDHRVQLLVRDALLWREAQQKAKTAVTRPVPPVQRPGVAPHKGAAREAEFSNLSQQLDKATSDYQGVRIGAQLLAARRAARRYDRGAGDPRCLQLAPGKRAIQESRAFCAGLLRQV